jgi:hypothetical protein
MVCFNLGDAPEEMELIYGGKTFIRTVVASGSVGAGLSGIVVFILHFDKGWTAQGCICDLCILLMQYFAYYVNDTSS